MAWPTTKVHNVSPLAAVKKKEGRVLQSMPMLALAPASSPVLLCCTNAAMWNWAYSIKAEVGDLPLTSQLRTLGRGGVGRAASDR